MKKERGGKKGQEKERKVEGKERWEGKVRERRE